MYSCIPRSIGWFKRNNASQARIFPYTQEGHLKGVTCVWRWRERERDGESEQHCKRKGRRENRGKGGKDWLRERKRRRGKKRRPRGAVITLWERMQAACLFKTAWGKKDRKTGHAGLNGNSRLQDKHGQDCLPFPPFLYSFKKYCLFFFFCMLYKLSLFTCVSFSCSLSKSSVVLSDTFGVWFERMFLESIRFVPLRAFLKWCEVVGYTFNSKTVDLFCELLKALVIDERSCASFIRKSCHFWSTFESFWFCFWKTLIKHGQNIKIYD